MTDTVKTQIDRIKQNVADVYTTLGEHLVELPVLQDSDHMAETINSADFNILGLDLKTTIGIDVDLNEYEVIEIAEQTARGEIVNQDITLTSNGVYTHDTPYSGFGTVTVQYGDIRLQDKTITTNGTYRADNGYTGLGVVTVAVPADTYISDIKAALVTLGLTPPTDDSELANFIATTYSDIHTQLSNIHGE